MARNFLIINRMINFKFTQVLKPFPISNLPVCRGPYLDGEVRFVPQVLYLSCILKADFKLYNISKVSQVVSGDPPITM